MALRRMENGREIIVNNGDILVLQRVFYAMQDVCMIEERCRWEEERRYSISQRISQGRGGGTPKGIDAGLARMDELIEDHKRVLERYGEEVRAAERILSGIRNPNMKTFVMMMYVFMLPGEEIRKRLNMSPYAFRQARRMIEEARDMESVRWQDRYAAAENSREGEKNA